MKCLKAMGLNIRTPLDDLWNSTGVSYWDFLRLCGRERTPAKPQHLERSILSVPGVFSP